MMQRMTVSVCGYDKVYLFVVTINQSSWYVLFLRVVYIDLN
jgi:hypothetical protein